MLFELRHFDRSLLSFSMDGGAGYGCPCHIVSVSKGALQHLPYGLEAADQSLHQWLKARTIPKHRAFVDVLLARNGLSLNDLSGILSVSMGLSLNDCYWVPPKDFKGSFLDYDLYSHDFRTALALLAFTGYGTRSCAGFSSSPEFTTNGMLPKAWRRIGGQAVLYKGGTSGGANTSLEPYSEYLSSEVAAAMGIPHVTYGLSKWKGQLCSTCPVFCSLEKSYVPMCSLLKDPDLKKIQDCLSKLGSKFAEAFHDMLIFDALICNTDRHLGNFGLLVDSKTLKPISLAPLFDHGRALFPSAMPEDIKNLDTYSKAARTATGETFQDCAARFMGPAQKARLRRMLDFRFLRHPYYNMPKERTKALEHFLRQRAASLLAL